MRITLSKRSRQVVAWTAYLLVTVLYICAILRTLQHSAGLLSVHPIRAPARVRPLPDPPEKYTNQEVEAMRVFGHWLDSLRQDPAGRVRYDSFIRARPGLLDSARKASEYYHLHDLFKW